MSNRIHEQGYTKHTRDPILYEKVTQVPLDAIGEYIRYLRTLDVNTTPISSFQAHYYRLISFFDVTLIGAWYYPGLYRARLGEEKELLRLLHPPKDAVTVMGRCNDVGESYLYCSNSYVTSVLELKPKPGDIITVLLIQLDNNDSCNFPRAITVAHNKLNDGLINTFVQCDNPGVREKLEMINEFFSEIMLQDVTQGHEDKYKRSIALSQAHLAVSNDPLCGLVYPSKASNLFGINYALQPAWWQQLKNPCYKAFRVQIVSKTGDFDAVALLTQVATEMDPTGTFHFKDVTTANMLLSLNHRYYEDYEQMFTYQRSLLSPGSFFRRFYPPPLLNPPYNLIPLENVQYYNAVTNRLETING